MFPFSHHTFCRRISKREPTKAFRRRRQHLRKQRQNVERRVSCPISPWKIRRFSYDDVLCTVGRAPRLCKKAHSRVSFPSYYNYTCSPFTRKVRYERKILFYAHQNFLSILLNTWLFQLIFSTRILALLPNASDITLGFPSWNFLALVAQQTKKRAWPFLYTRAVDREIITKSKSPSNDYGTRCELFSQLTCNRRRWKSLNILDRLINVVCIIKLSIYQKNQKIKL